MATVGFNMHKVQKGKVVIKVWDMGGQEKYRGMWERCQQTRTHARTRGEREREKAMDGWPSGRSQSIGFRRFNDRFSLVLCLPLSLATPPSDCRGVEVIVFVVDSSDAKLFPLAQKEMQSLLAQPTLAGVPLLVLLNKNDLATAVDPTEIVKELQLDTLTNREVSYYSISCKNIINIDRTLEFLIKQKKKANKTER